MKKLILSLAVFITAQTFATQSYTCETQYSSSLFEDVDQVEILIKKNEVNLDFKNSSLGQISITKNKVEDVPGKYKAIKGKISKDKEAILQINEDGSAEIILFDVIRPFFFFNNKEVIGEIELDCF